ncbi:MAG: amidohydrolase family protein [Actinobacteria bacterium]|nr:amidohydrolase family protein [Actinomycetota bacterium]
MCTSFSNNQQSALTSLARSKSPIRPAATYHHCTGQSTTRKDTCICSEALPGRQWPGALRLTLANIRIECWRTLNKANRVTSVWFPDDVSACTTAAREKQIHMPVTAIDVHVHIHDPRARERLGPEAKRRFEQQARYFGREPRYLPVEEQAEQYRERNMMAALMNGTDETITGLPMVPNDFVAETVAAHPETFLGFGAIDPWQGELARQEIRRCKELGLHGIGELNPARQHFYPNDQRFYPLWREAEEQGLPILFHSGYAAAGSRQPGGGGVKLKYTQPLLLDDVAADFPELKIICAHPSWPWTAESLAIARHKTNFFIDLSGWAPKYFPEELVQQVNTLLQDKALFGSDAPSLPFDRWLREFDELPLKPEVRPKILLENAKRLFGLDV